jgi:hypothetical protein
MSRKFGLKRAEAASYTALRYSIETRFAPPNDANMEEAGILEKSSRWGVCYQALNRHGSTWLRFG